MIWNFLTSLLLEIDVSNRVKQLSVRAIGYTDCDNRSNSTVRTAM